MIKSDMMTTNKRFKSTIMCKGTGEFSYIKIEDMNNHIIYHISSDNNLNYLLNSLNEDIVDLKSKRKPLWCKIKERIRGCND